MDLVKKRVYILDVDHQHLAWELGCCFLQLVGFVDGFAATAI